MKRVTIEGRCNVITWTDVLNGILNREWKNKDMQRKIDVWISVWCLLFFIIFQGVIFPSFFLPLHVVKIMTEFPTWLYVTKCKSVKHPCNKVQIYARFALFCLFYIRGYSRLSLRENDPATARIHSRNVPSTLTKYRLKTRQASQLNEWNNISSQFPSTWTEQPLRLGWHLSLLSIDIDQCKQS